MTEHPNLAAALAGFQAELPKIIKDETAKVAGKDGKQGYTYGYADLAQVTETVSPILGKHGLAFTAKPTMTEQGFGLVYKLMHGASGETDEGFWPISNGPMQQIGSAITYARRYALMAATNTFPDKEDDDGAAATQAHRGRGSASGSTDESWDSAAPARPAQPTREQLVNAGHKAIAAAVDVAALQQLREKVDGYAVNGAINDDTALEMYAAINAREAELNGNSTDTIPAPATALDGPPIRDEQRRKLFGLFNELGVADRTKQMELLRRVANRPLESRNDLSADEAKAAISVLEAQKAQRANGREPAAA
jgi:hypothetical protein